MKKYFSTFVGIPLPREINDEYNKLLDEFKGKSRLFDLANRYTPHITLSFLGERSESELTDADVLLEQNLDLFKGQNIKITGLGQFSPKSPRVVFLKVDPAELVKPQNELKEKLDVIEEKEFYPHLTVFRLRSEEAQTEFQQNLSEIEKLSANIDWQFPIEELAIYGVDQAWPREGQKILFRHKL